MKNLALLLGLLFLSSSASACPDISGKYLIGEKYYIRYEQKGCESLTQYWCSKGGAQCRFHPYTWPLNGTMVQWDEQSADWAAFSIEGDSLHRTQLKPTEITITGQACVWKNDWMSKEPNGDLKVTFEVKCGNEKDKMVSEIWKHVP